MMRSPPIHFTFTSEMVIPRKIGPVKRFRVEKRNYALPPPLRGPISRAVHGAYMGRGRTKTSLAKIPAHGPQHLP